MNFDITEIKSIVNPIFGLPTPHQQSVERITKQLADVQHMRDFVFSEWEKTVQQETCKGCDGSGVVTTTDDEQWDCPYCSGSGVAFVSPFDPEETKRALGAWS